MALQSSKILLYNDGEGLSFDDLNNAQKGHTQRSWEWPDYATACGFSQAIDGTNFETVFGAPETSGMGQVVFCKGQGPGLYADALDLTLGAGFMGVYTGNASPIALEPKMRWIYGDYNSVVFSLTAAGSGLKRYDVLTLAIDEEDGENEDRDFEDSVTGAKTTESLPKKRSLTGTFNITQGAEDADPTPPLMSATDHVVALILVNDTAIETVHDCMMPFGPVHSHITYPGKDSSYNVGDPTVHWSVVGTRLLCIHSGFGTNVALAWLFPRMFAGDATARLIGVELGFPVFDATATVEVIAFGPGPQDETILQSITSIAASSMRIDLRGYPFWLSGARGPFWGHGGRAKVPQLTTMPGTTIGLKLHSRLNDSLDWIRWHFVKA